MGAGPSHVDHGHEHHMREMQHRMDEMHREARRVAEENEARRAQEAKKHAEEMQREAKRVAEENEARRKEAVRQMEEMQREAKRVAEENEARREEAVREMQREAKRVAEENEARREEELRLVQETMRIQEENRKLQEKIRMEEERRKMEEHARKLEEEAKARVEKADWLREEAERNLENGIPPVKYPTGDDVRIVRERLQFQEGNLHIAITGVSGSGKSSLINAFRGFTSKHQHAAKTGTNETTEAIGRFCDPARPWMTWYDVPGAGTLKVPDWQYFNDQGLFIFDIIIIAIDIRFTKIDAGLLFNCNRFGIPAFVVRSKANQHISNIMEEDRESEESDDDDDDDRDSPQNTKKRFIKARNKYVTETRQEFAAIFAKVGLPPQKVYIVSKDSARSVVKGSKTPVDVIDEMDLIEDILQAANERCSKGQSQPA